MRSRGLLALRFLLAARSSRLALGSLLGSLALCVTACDASPSPPEPGPSSPTPIAAHPASSAAAAGITSDARPALHAADPPGPEHAAAPAASLATPPSSALAPAATSATSAETAASYPWLGDPSLAAAAPPPVDTLLARFPSPPPGFTRVDLAGGSFGAWLRHLPLAAPGTPVLRHSGGVILPPDHRNLAAVVAIDIGQADLQQCADAIIRLHAEWRWARGDRDLSYRAGAGIELPFDRWVRGERPVQRGEALVWEPKTRSSPKDHPTFRGWLDGVFMWANTGALAQQAQPVAVEQIAPGDFVVQPGTPGHAVLVVDVARASDGRAALLLAQSFMPAQNVHVLRPSVDATWFVVSPDDQALVTPFWKPFPWRWLRRFEQG
ncbi:DUF4846 domain-containing protein [Chondromyces crocatus]|uniref:DUF4846 domain-containing protein n=1 Tax=Chondromyces crocatus TaxID=52 RepID=A0A0K1E8S0_CHOCO|nr:DUF4846 domain-containing protein [Chondromyces crocatus]AKT37254.1 uncharacterized protein CMC5_013850 [Chondromyces crocatus]